MQDDTQRIFDRYQIKIDTYNEGIENMKQQGQFGAANKLQAELGKIEAERDSLQKRFDQAQHSLAGKDLIFEAEKGNIPTPGKQAVKHFDVIEAARRGANHE